MSKLLLPYKFAIKVYLCVTVGKVFNDTVNTLNHFCGFNMQVIISRPANTGYLKIHN